MLSALLPQLLKSNNGAWEENAGGQAALLEVVKGSLEGLHTGAVGVFLDAKPSQVLLSRLPIPDKHTALILTPV